jgi:bile acid:Na+ symporter, BASS family
MRSHTSPALNLMLQRFLFIWLVLLSAVAYAWPDIVGGSPGAARFDPFVLSAPYLPHLFAAAMFAIGWMLPRDEVLQVGRRWPAVLLGTSLQYVTMPALAFLAARLFGFTGDALIGVVLVGCVPGAMASNVLTLLARGNASYSVSLTTLATLLSPLAVPLALRLTLDGAKDVQLDFFQVSWTLCLTVVFPVIAGHVLGRLFPKGEKPARRVASTVANLVILWVIAVVVGKNRQDLAQVTAALIVSLLLVNAAGYAAGYAGGAAMRLPEPMRRALTLEIGMQNAGLGATLATQLFPDRPAAALAPALYTFGCMLTGTFLARLWSSRPTAKSRQDLLSAKGCGECEP